MIFFSVFGIGMASYNKIVNPEPIKDGIIVFIVSAIFGLLMLLLSIYQYFTGRRSSNFAIMCQSVDSRNHFLTSLLVCAGIILSLFAERYAASWLYYADAVASIIIGCLIFKSGIELLIELIKPGGEPEHVAHFMQKAQERMRKRMIFDWLSGILKDNSLSLKEIEERFKTRFCSQPPKIMSLTGFGYWPERSSDFNKCLEYFIKEKKIVKEKGKYILSSDL